MKNNLIFVYSSYAVTSFFSRSLPRILPRKFVDSASKNFTLAYSNTPGPIKPLYYEDSKGTRIYSVWAKNFVMVAGYVGMCVSCLSFDKSFMISISADSGMVEKKTIIRLMELIEGNIKTEMERINAGGPSSESKKDK